MLALPLASPTGSKTTASAAPSANSASKFSTLVSRGCCHCISCGTSSTSGKGKLGCHSKNGQPPFILGCPSAIALASTAAITESGMGIMVHCQWANHQPVVRDIKWKSPSALLVELSTIVPVLLDFVMLDGSLSSKTMAYEPNSTLRWL